MFVDSRNTGNGVGLANEVLGTKGSTIKSFFIKIISFVSKLSFLIVYPLEPKYVASSLSPINMYLYKFPLGRNNILKLNGWNNVNGKLVKNESEFKVIKRVKNLRSRGYSWRKISNRLNDDRISSKDGGIWYDGSLYNMMRGYTK